MPEIFPLRSRVRVQFRARVMVFVYYPTVQRPLQGDYFRIREIVRVKVKFKVKGWW